MKIRIIIALLMGILPSITMAQPKQVQTRKRTTSIYRTAQKASTATISGLVTFTVNSTYGNRPDLGSVVYLIPADKVPVDFTSNVNKLTDQAKMFRYCRNADKKFSNLGYDSGAKSILGNSYVEPKEFWELSFKVQDQYNNIKKEAISEVLVEVDGKYKITAKPGNYYILFVSANKKYDYQCVAFEKGLFYAEKCDISKEKKSIVKSYNFDFKEDL